MADWLYGWLIGGGLGLTLGTVIGRALEAWDWRMIADSHHHSHKSAGRWFRVLPEEGHGGRGT